MNTDDLKQHFGGLTNAARVLGVSRATLYNWRADGIPRDDQIEIQKQTGGALKCDEAILQTMRELVGQAV